LPVKSLPVETGTALFGGFNELRKERTHRKTIVESNGGRLSIAGHAQPYTYISPTIFDSGDQFRRDIMGMYVDCHGYSLGLPIELLRLGRMATQLQDPKCVASFLLSRHRLASPNIAIAGQSPVRHDLLCSSETSH
jgi:hypothetical protein